MNIPCLLTLITFLPAAAGAVLVSAKPLQPNAARAIALATTILVLILTGVAWFEFTPASTDRFQFVEQADWITSPGGLDIEYKMGVDGISLVMVVLTAFLMPAAILCSWKASKGFLAALLFLQTGMMGAFCALDLFLFYVFWEAMLIPMYLIIGIWGGPRRIYASVKFIIYTLAGSLLMLAAILYAYSTVPSFDVAVLQDELPRYLKDQPTAQNLLFLAFGLSFAIKVPMFPFHTWLPDAHVEAPTAGSVILAGVLLKLGGYGFLRFAIPFFPDAAVTFTPLIIVLSVVGIIYGAAMALAQSDIKKLVAYSSVSHLGFVMLGIFSGTLAGMQGGVLQMVNHGLSTGALFLLVGIIYEKTHRRGVNDFGGMAKVTPIYASFFLLVTLSSIGLPGLNGFVGEFLILFGSFPAHPAATAFAALGVVLGAVYMLRLYRNVFFGKVTRPERERTSDVGTFELAYLVPIAFFIVLLGVAPNAVLKKTEPASRSVIEQMKTSETVANEHGTR